MAVLESIDHACVPGAVTPPRALGWRDVVVRAIVHAQVGPIQVIGRHRLPARGPFVVAANHPHYADGFVLARHVGLPRETHYLVARGTLAWGRGLCARFLGPFGVICVDLAPGRGASALRSGVRVLASGSPVALFPEGWAQMSDRRGTFKRGAVFLARRASQVRGEPVPIVPIRLRYARLPGEWLTRCSPAVQYVIALLGSPVYRRGLTAIVGRPIWPDDLPDDDREATRWLEAHVRGLD